ncbi:MAG TPA: prephenate dehydratase [Syntrophales bacterium]|nr:prephenate dehydratase [Syntrophales bacterium]HOM07588.1 prephenate dehydratase [Syntrophales bacterium]HOO00207.1 prephenate dehydratase [Syntrophales bacterium]HPC01578.1 prephenate dehydratase [Syntrophales bacterium]HPQ07172.1 prephenate dehydratase [Syntrophales bacterium]
MTGTEMERLRAEIARLDEGIVALLNERAALARALGELKERAGMAFYDPAQEARVMERIARAGDGPLAPESLKEIYREILAACRALQGPVTVACLGPAGSFSHAAVERVFGRGARCLFAPAIPDVFDAAERDASALALVPVENSREGSVKTTLERLVTTPLVIVSEVCLRVSHCLVTADGGTDGIRRVYSHPQALGQCRRWLRENLPQALWVETESTARAVERARGEEDAAAVGGRLAAEIHGMKVAVEGIEDSPRNTTRFLVLGRRATPPSGRDKTSLLFTTRHAPGALHEALGPFAAAGVNLLRIESHPIRERMWEYLFFVDLEGHAGMEPLRSCLAALEGKTSSLKILGSYPRKEGD